MSVYLLHVFPCDEIRNDLGAHLAAVRNHCDDGAVSYQEIYGAPSDLSDIF